MKRRRTDNEAISKEGDPARYRRVLRTLALARISELEFASMARAYWTKGGIDTVPGEEDTFLIVRGLEKAHRIAHRVFDPRPCKAIDISRMAVERDVAWTYTVGKCASDHGAPQAIVDAALAVNRAHSFLEEVTAPRTAECNRVQVLHRLRGVIRAHKGSPERITQEDVAFALLVQRKIQRIARPLVDPQEATRRRVLRQPGTAYAYGADAYQVRDRVAIFPIDATELANAHGRMKADISQAKKDRKLPGDPKTRT